MQNKSVIVKDLGLVDYQQAWDYQETLFKSVIDVKIQNREKIDPALTPNYLLFCEHPHVYTLGKTGKEEHLLLDTEGLHNINADYYKINRGGDITYHGPGQLVVYPIFDLDNFFTDIHKYMRLLEEAVILTCKDYGIEAGRIAGLTGVWVNDRKICAFGVKSSRWVTMHGLALNIQPDLAYFGNIVPCGINDKAVTSLFQEIGQELSFEEIKKKLLNHLSVLFEFIVKE